MQYHLHRVNRIPQEAEEEEGRCSAERGKAIRLLRPARRGDDDAEK